MNHAVFKQLPRQHREYHYEGAEYLVPDLGTHFYVTQRYPE